MRAALVLAVCLTFAPVAWADELPGRYRIERVQDGFLRLDSVTGSIALCAPRNKVWSCTTVVDDIKTLRAENEMLKKRIAELDASLKTLDLPTDNDIKRLMAMLNRMIDGLVGMSRETETRGTI